MIFHMFRTAVVVVDDAHTAYTRDGAQTKGRITERGRGRKIRIDEKKKDEEEVERRACIVLV
jgi:hypothetical protein